MHDFLPLFSTAIHDDMSKIFSIYGNTTNHASKPKVLANQKKGERKRTELLDIMNTWQSYWEPIHEGKRGRVNSGAHATPRNILFAQVYYNNDDDLVLQVLFLLLWLGEIKWEQKVTQWLPFFFYIFPPLDWGYFLSFFFFLIDKNELGTL